MPALRVNDQFLLFSHIPKTGGTSIEQYLKKKGEMILYSPRQLPGMLVSPQHMNTALINQLYPPDFFFEKFAVMRDPIDRLISEYRYVKKLKLPFEIGGAVRKNIFGVEKKMPFNDWALRALEACAENPFFGDNHIRPQSDFIDSDTRVFLFEEGIDKVYRWIDLQTNTTAESDTKRHNVSKSKIPEVSKKTRAAAELFYQADYDALEKLRNN